MATTDPPQTPSDTVSFQRFVGLKNVVGEERLTPQEFSSAINIDLDDAGQVRRRRGQTLVASGNWHSLYSTNAGTVLGVRNQSLGIVGTDYTFRALIANIGANPATGFQLQYEQVGTNVYYTSPFDSGIYSETTQTIGPWGSETDLWLSPVVNPTANIGQIRGRLLGKPPNAAYMTYWNGRIYLAQGSLVWATELYNYNYVDKTRGFYQFDADITMIGAVGDGVYVGTAEGLWFLSGTHAEGLKRVRVMDSAVIPGSRIYMPAELANPPQIDLGSDTPLSLAILFMTVNGYCAGQNSGQAYNLTESKFIFPAAVRAYPFYRKQDGMHHYVAALDSGGTPTSNARFGDYVDAELVRASNWMPANDGVVMGDNVQGLIVPPTGNFNTGHFILTGGQAVLF